MPSSYREQIGQGIALFLHDADRLTWSAGYAYDGSTEWPTYVQQDAPQTPHQMVQIAVGTVTPQHGADYLAMIQVRVRGDIDGAEATVGEQMQGILDTLYPNGKPLVHKRMGGGVVRVGRIQQLASTPLGRDKQRRYSEVVNYWARVRRARNGSLYSVGLYSEGIYG